MAPAARLGGFNLIWRGEAVQRLPLASAPAAHDGLRAAPGAGRPGSGTGGSGLPTRGGGSWGWERDGVLSRSLRGAAWQRSAFLLRVLDIES